MLHFIARNWWLLVLRGICAILFGVLALTSPGITLGALVLLFGAYAFADGILAFVAAFSNSTGRPWWALVLEGLSASPLRRRRFSIRESRGRAALRDRRVGDRDGDIRDRSCRSTP
jgi:hypothetical protein